MNPPLIASKMTEGDIYFTLQKENRVKSSILINCPFDIVRTFFWFIYLLLLHCCNIDTVDYI